MRNHSTALRNYMQITHTRRCQRFDNKSPDRSWEHTAPIRIKKFVTDGTVPKAFTRRSGRQTDSMENILTFFENAPCRRAENSYKRKEFNLASGPPFA